jgi:RsiW-degrading membrane proteinase PrsW (M82 family)
LFVGIALFVIPNMFESNETDQAWAVYWIIGVYIAFLVSYYVHEVCGRTKRLWLMGCVALFTFAAMVTPLWHSWYNFFYYVIPAAQWKKSTDAIVELAGNWFGTGLCEEGFKALPLLALALAGAGLAYLGRRSSGRSSALWRFLAKRLGLREPLDGIILGVASGSGFFVRETLGQYVPQTMSKTASGSPAFEGLVLLLARGLPQLAEHCAWAGLFGYFIGLSVLRPRMAWVLLPIGWFSAAALHGAWDGISDVTGNGLVIIGFLILLGIFSYALLAGAIFKAREISPTLAARFAPAAGPMATAPAAALAAAAPPPLPDASDWD